MANFQYIVEESSVEETADGISATDVFLVTGITGAITSRAYRARLVAGVPRRGDPHPSIPDLFADSIAVRPIDVSQFKVFASYTPKGDETDPNGGSFEGWSILNDKETNFDKDGNLLLTAYTYPAGDENGRAGKIEVQGGVVTIPDASLGLRFTRREMNISLAQGLVYAGKLNRYTWNGFAARAVLFLGRRFNTVAFTDAGIEWSVSYEFQIGDHTRFISFKDPEKNEIPPDLLRGTGYFDAESIPDIDFAPLGLDFVT